MAILLFGPLIAAKLLAGVGAVGLTGGLVRWFGRR
jgi:hypothetical protein